VAWKDVSPMEQKLLFIADYRRGAASVTELCERFGVSRKTGYKWIGRYEQGGGDGLRDRSRRPHASPAQTAPELVEAIVEARLRHPTWGSKKLLKILSKQQPEAEWPSRVTVCDILRRRGLVRERSRRRKVGHPGKPVREATGPNQIWAVDYKGQFKTRDGRYCYPLTMTDHYSRYLIECRALWTTCVAEAKPVFIRAFREHGLPDVIRSDNGVPFATTGLGRLSALSAWWIRLGIIPELIEPAKPYQNGRHERMHRTLKAETTRPPAFDRRTQQRAFNRFREEYNQERPHEAIELETPSALYRRSAREYPERLAQIEYPTHYAVRLVSYNGGIRWCNQWVGVSTTCAGEYVGLEEVDDGMWDVYFGPLKLGRLLEEHMRIEDHLGRLRRA
jgi:putative transposase